MTSAVSVVLPRASSPQGPLAVPLDDELAQLAVLMRLPLCARATVPPAVPPSVGWAFCQVEPPVVEYRRVPDGD